jgi:hypothetical protein
MGLLSWLQKRVQEEVTGTRVLVCGLGAQFTELVTADGRIWKRFYPSVTANIVSELSELFECLERRYDAVHLFCQTSPRGVITDDKGRTVTGTDIIQKCADCDVKLLWIASDNTSEAYITGFNAKGKRLNLVMTIGRQGANFGDSLEKLLSRMSRGERMPVAWNALWPQIPNASHPDAPNSIFFAGRGGVVLLP